MAERIQKIGVVSISLARGGVERSTAILTKMLHAEGYDVHLVLLTDAIDYEFEGQLFNLGINKTFPERPWTRLKRIRKLRKYLKDENFDFIIDNRSRQFPVIEWMYLNYAYLNFKFIYIIHSGNIQNYLTKNTWISRLMLKKAYKIVSVSKRMSELINSKFKTSKSITIYNPFDDFMLQNVKTETNKPYVLFLGRFDEQVKNLSLLIESYSQSQLSDNAVQLHLVGDGKDKGMIQQKIDKHGLQQEIKIFPYTKNVYPLLRNALFLVLTSRYEGFPMVLIEALSVGTPVISVDCQTGPSEIIQHEHNGLLVENHNPKALSDAFNRFLLDDELYNRCKNNCVQSVSHLNQKNIAKQWSKILKDE